MDANNFGIDSTMYCWVSKAGILYLGYSLVCLFVLRKPPAAREIELKAALDG